MWTRAELKEKGKYAFRRNFWLCVLVALIFAIASRMTSGNNNFNNTNNQNSHSTVFQWEEDSRDYLEDNLPIHGRGLDYAKAVTGNLSIHVGPFKWIYNGIMSSLSILIIAATFAGILLISIFLLNPLKVGCNRFFYNNLYEKAGLREIAYVFNNGWLNTGLTLFIRDIKIMLWTLLFIVPGIIKTYEYRMIPYLLAENPEMSRAEAFRESRALMDGQKFNAFILDLSFIGWHFLGAITLGIVNVFWTSPYQESTNAALYAKLRNGYYY